MYEVKDGARTLQFEGVRLAASTSERPDSPRWIEFELYKTDGGKYVLSRVGVSLIYHSAVCPLVVRYGLHEDSEDKLSLDAVPCDSCRPGKLEPIVYPEKTRYWTLVSFDPYDVIDALYTGNSRGPKYLTKVAERLLDVASNADVDIDAAYKIQIVL